MRCSNTLSESAKSCGMTGALFLGELMVLWFLSKNYFGNLSKNDFRNIEIVVDLICVQNVAEVLSTVLAGPFNILRRTHISNAFQYIETMDNSQSSIFKCQDYSNLQYSFHPLEQLVETIEQIFKTFNLSTILHVEFVSRCIRNCSDDADGISKVMFSGDGREGVSQPASQLYWTYPQGDT